MARQSFSTEGRRSHLQGLITDSLKLRRGIEEAETVLIRLLRFNIRVSSLPGQLLGQRFGFLQSAEGENRGLCENSLYLFF